MFRFGFLAFTTCLISSGPKALGDSCCNPLDYDPPICPCSWDSTHELRFGPGFGLASATAYESGEGGCSHGDGMCSGDDVSFPGLVAYSEFRITNHSGVLRRVRIRLPLQVFLSADIWVQHSVRHPQGSLEWVDGANASAEASVDGNTAIMPLQLVSTHPRPGSLGAVVRSHSDMGWLFPYIDPGGSYYYQLRIVIQAWAYACGTDQQFSCWSPDGCGNEGCSVGINRAHAQGWVKVRTQGVLVSIEPDDARGIVFGDVDLNGQLDLNDYEVFRQCLLDGSTTACVVFDAEPDGDVDLADFARLQSEWRVWLTLDEAGFEMVDAGLGFLLQSGDLNRDRRVNLADWAAITAQIGGPDVFFDPLPQPDELPPECLNFGPECSFEFTGTNLNFALADVDGDGDVDLADFAEFQQQAMTSNY